MSWKHTRPVDHIPNVAHTDASSFAAQNNGVGLALAAVVAELREGLRAHDIRARDVGGTATVGHPARVDVSGLSLGDAAVLALVLNESAPARTRAGRTGG